MTLNTLSRMLCFSLQKPMARSLGLACLMGMAHVPGSAPAQQPVTPQITQGIPAPTRQATPRKPTDPADGRMIPPPQLQGLDDPFRTPLPGQGMTRNGFDQQDPTQAAPDMRRILEGEQEQVRRDPPPPIEVVGKIIGKGGRAKALLRVSGRYYLVEQGTRFSLPSNLEPLLYTVSGIDANGIDIQGGEGNQTQRLQ